MDAPLFVKPHMFSYFRDIQIRKNVVTRLEECETRLTEETKERQSGEKEVRAKLESQSQTLQSYMDNTADVIRKLTEVCCSKNVLLVLLRFPGQEYLNYIFLQLTHTLPLYTRHVHEFVIDIFLQIHNANRGCVNSPPRPELQRRSGRGITQPLPPILRMGSCTESWSHGRGKFRETRPTKVPQRPHHPC